LEDGGSLGNLSLALLNLGKDHRQTSRLLFYENLQS
jgi:hypothetical protein